MIGQAYIAGQKYKAEAKYINMVISEWYVPPATDQMSLEMLTTNAANLQSQVEMWNSDYEGANKKERKNLDKIISVQQGKLDQYNAMIQAKQTATTGGAPMENPGGSPTDPPSPKPPQQNSGGISPVLLIGGAALLIMMFKK